ncbi:hypothetical protein ABMA27_001441 [Loxostege sticticalis]|uniref:Homeobox domain-containing protein n=1 Tax=Loxostege sticticalis TaxID=481309 RepID=A0ABR3HYH2_LOXSC
MNLNQLNQNIRDTVTEMRDERKCVKIVCIKTPLKIGQNRQNNVYWITSSSPNMVHEDATIDDWEAYLMRKTIQPHNTRISDPLPTSVESTVGKIRQPHKHYAHISFVPSVYGLRAVVSHKRRRTAFTTDQITALEEVFRGRPYVTSDERGVLGRRLAVSDQAIKVWFQNRRLREKREREELELELSQAYADSNPFAHTEGLINHADKDGIVTLDHQSINELVSAIDKALPQDLDLAKLAVDLGRNLMTEEKKSYVIYEPVSRSEVGVSSQVSCTQEWRKFETINPKQAFLRLLGVQSLNR